MGKSPSFANSYAVFQSTIYLAIQPFLSPFVAPVSSWKFLPGLAQSYIDEYCQYSKLLSCKAGLNLLPSSKDGH
jgi:hypothetical protein